MINLQFLILLLLYVGVATFAFGIDRKNMEWRNGGLILLGIDVVMMLIIPILP